MRIIRDFTCRDCGEINEEYVDQSVELVLCGCGGIAKKDISAPAYIKIGKFRSTIDSEAWAKDRTKMRLKSAENGGM